MRTTIGLFELKEIIGPIALQDLFEIVKRGESREKRSIRITSRLSAHGSLSKVEHAIDSDTGVKAGNFVRGNYRDHLFSLSVQVLLAGGRVPKRQYEERS